MPNNSNAPAKPQTVMVEVKFYVEVPVVKDGPDNTPIAVDQDQATSIVLDAIDDQDWGGYSMLGKAFSNAGLHTWDASSIRAVRKFDSDGNAIDYRSFAQVLADRVHARSTQ